MIHIWFGESPGDLFSSLFKLGRCDLYLRFKLMIFLKPIFDFSQTAAHILIKFGSYMHLSKITQVYSYQIPSNYANELLGSYVTCIFTMYFYMSLCDIPFWTSSF